MYVAVTRRTESGRVIGPEQRVSREQALRMATIDAAYLSFDEKRKGSIEVGKRWPYVAHQQFVEKRLGRKRMSA